MRIVWRIAAKIEKYKFLLAIGKKIEGKNQEELIEYFRKRFNMSFEALLSAALLLSLLFGLIAFCLLIRIGVFLALICSLLTFYITFFSIKNSATSFFEKERIIHASLAPLVFYELSLNFKATNSIFEAIKSVAQSNYPIISQKFKDILRNTMFGHPPEKLLFNYALAQPSNDFKTAILTILNIGKNDVNNIKEYFCEIENEHEKLNREIEMRILLLVTISTFLPFLLTMTYALWGYTWLIPTIPLVQVFLQKLPSRKILSPLSKDLKIGQRTVVNELEECAEFLETYSKFLELNYSPEKALAETIKKVSKRISKRLAAMIKDVFFRLIPLNVAWTKFIANFRYPYAIISLKAATQILEKDSKKSGEKISEISTQLREIVKFIRKRETLIATQRLKARIITMVLTMLLGFIAAIIPMITYSTMFIFNKSFNLTFDNLFITSSLLATSVIATYANCKATMDPQTKLQVLLTVLIFLLTYNVTSLFSTINMLI